MMNAISFYRIGRFCKLKGIPIIPKIIEMIIFLLYNSYIPSSCSIGRNTIFAYKGIGVVLHSRTTIGNNCIIGTNVTVGGKESDSEPPVIGDNVYIASGAKVIGNIRIGNNCTIGVNAVVNKSFPDNCVLAGVPAKKIKENKIK